MIWHTVKASCFADPKDLKAFKSCKALGYSDSFCFKTGDNGIGCWGDNTTTLEPQCALPPDDMIARWGSTKAAKHKIVTTKANGKTVDCRLTDRMRWKSNIPKGHASLDLNPGASKSLGLKMPFLVNATWAWKADLA